LLQLEVITTCNMVCKRFELLLFESFIILDHLPISIRVLLESAVRHCDAFHVRQCDVDNLLNYEQTCRLDIEIPFTPARVLLQDFT